MTELLTIEALLAPWFKELGVVDTSPFQNWLADADRLSVDKDSILVHAGEYSRHIYFIHSGLLRLFYTTPDGKERNKAFYGPGHTLGAVSASIAGTVAPFTIQALEDCQLVRANFDSLYSDAHQHPALSRAVIELLAAAFIRNEQREAMLLTRNAKQRYQWLWENEPELLERLPQFHIASYLGVDAVSLSRLKQKRKHGEDSGS